MTTAAPAPPSAARPAAEEEMLLVAGATPEAALLTLQVDEVLAEATPEYDSVLPAAAALLAALDAALAAHPPSTLPVSRVAGLAGALGVDVPSRLRWEAPAAPLALAGAAAARASVLTPSADASSPPLLLLDAALAVPRGCVDEKDCKNGKWALRRAAYLAAAADAVAARAKKKAKAGRPNPLAGASVAWADVDGDARRPAVVVTAAVDAAAPVRLAVRLLPVTPAASVPTWLPKLAPDRRGVGGGGGGGGATPCYNAAVAADASSPAAWAAAAVAACPAAADGIALATAWAAAQRLDPASDPTAGVTFSLLAALAADAAASGALSKAMTPLQAVRALLAAVAGVASLPASGRRLRGDGDARLPPPPPLHAFAALTPPALVAPDGWTNLTAAATPAGLARAAASAGAAVAALDAARGAGGDAAATVDALWLARRPSRWLPDYDAFWRVALLGEEGGDRPLSGDVPAARAAEATVAAGAARALGPRAVVVRALPRALVTDPVAGPAVPPHMAVRSILLAARVDAVAFRRRLDVGPRADAPADAAAFRAFWGDRAELRRFEDGSIHEAVLWDAPPGGGPGGAAAADAAVAAALARHVPGGAAVAGLTGALAPALADRGVDPAAAAAAPAALDAALARLGKLVRSVPGVALRPLSVTPLSRAARRADPFPPLPHPLLVSGGGATMGGTLAAGGRGVPRVAPAVRVGVQVEGSGRWPDDPAAAAKVRAALGVQLATALTDAFGVSAVASEAGVDVVVDGFAFRLRLWTDRDADAAARAAAAAAAAARAGAPPPPLSPASAAALADVGALQTALAHAGVLAPLAGAAPGFADGARLLARWAGGHLASPAVADPAWELLAAAAAGPRGSGGAGAGLAPAAGGGALENATPASPDAPPATGLAVFAAALRLLACTPWGERPLLVDPAGAMPAAARAAALRGGGAGGGAGADGASPAAPLRLASPADPSGAAWTGACPRPAAARLTALAGAALAALDAWLEADGGAGADADGASAAAAVFRPALADFDALIWMRPSSTPGGGRRLLPGAPDPPAGRAGRDARPAGRCGAAIAEIPASALASRGAVRCAADVLVGFDPVARYAAALRERYGAIALVGVDASGGGGPAVGVRWRPAARKPAAPGALPAPTAPVGAGWRPGKAVALVALDDDAAVAEMAALGAGLTDGYTLVKRLAVADEAGGAAKKRARV